MNLAVLQYLQIGIGLRGLMTLQYQSAKYESAPSSQLVQLSIKTGIRGGAQLARLHTSTQQLLKVH